MSEKDTFEFGKKDLSEELKKELDAIRKYIPSKAYRTILGRMKAGKVEAARVGIERIRKKVEGGKLHGNDSN